MNTTAISKMRNQYSEHMARHLHVLYVHDGQKSSLMSRCDPSVKE
jgi:hypothetical protein